MEQKWKHITINSLSAGQRIQYKRNGAMKPQFTVFIYPGWLLRFYSVSSFSSFSAFRKEGQFSICVKKEETADLILSPMT